MGEISKYDRIMKKKMYNQPEIMISNLMPTTIICASIGEGENTSNQGGGGGGGSTIGD